MDSDNINEMYDDYYLAEFEDAIDKDFIEYIRSAAESIVKEEKLLALIKKDHIERTRKLEERKTKLATDMNAAGVVSQKFDNGLNPSVSTAMKIYKAAGVTDDMISDWYESVGLGECVKTRRSVHHQTMQASIKERLDQDKDVPPALFNVSKAPTVKLGGKSKYLNDNPVELKRD